jgi:hypothetical protein
MASQLGKACPDCRLQIEDSPDEPESYQIHLKSFLATTLRVRLLEQERLASLSARSLIDQSLT